MTGRILIADTLPTHRILLQARLREAAYGTILAGSAEVALSEAQAGHPDVVLIAEDVAADHGLALLRQLRAAPETAQIPAVVLGADHDRARQIDAVAAGADAVLPRMPDIALLRAWLRNLMRRRAEEAESIAPLTGTDRFGFAEAAARFDAPALEVGLPTAHPGQIALIAAGRAEGLSWRNGLTARMRDRIAVLDPTHALSALSDIPAPDAVVIGDQGCRGAAPMDLITDLRSRAETRNAALLVVQDAPDRQATINALDRGASDVAQHGFHPGEMAQRLRREIVRKARADRRRAALHDSYRLAHTDPLTGVANRRRALGHLSAVMDGAARSGQHFAVMVLDLDRFKAVNDLYGHAAGDAVLKTLAARMSGCLRQGDLLARIGGEEFLAVLRECEPGAARIAAERLRGAVAEAPVALPTRGAQIAMTVSVGMVIGGPGGAAGSPAELIDLADRGLYAAKSYGRNQVTEYRTAA